MINPYRPTTVSLDSSAPTSEESQGFPFLLVARWTIAVSIIAYGGMRLIDLVNGWSWFATRAVMGLLYNPYVRLAAELCILATGILLFRRSIFVFIPLLGHCAIFLWFVFGFGPVEQLPGFVFVMWSAQLGLLGFCFLLLFKRRLR